VVIDFIVKLILGFIARAVDLTVASLDFNTQRVQPWLVLAQGNAPAHMSLLLDYPGLFGPFIPLTAFRNRHWLVLLTSVISSCCASSG
jgi:hypothetical protein